MDKILESCTLCPRRCKVNREAGKRGYCSVDARVVVARAALHMWEEPCISGERGSGAVFFCGCSLHCIFCQNHEISAGRGGQVISAERLAEIFLELEAQGAANINLVTAAQYVPQTVQALLRAKDQGLNIPVVYNSGGYESVETLKRLDGLVDIYLPDFKYMEPDLAARFSHAADYPQIAKEAIREMVRQSGPCVFGEDGYLKRGTVVRHLLMPGHTRNSKAVLAYLYETFGDTIYISIMNQYTPVQEQTEYPELNRKVTRREYEKVLEYALDLGIKNGFFQEGETAAQSFIPQFDLEGVNPKTR